MKINEFKKNIIKFLKKKGVYAENYKDDRIFFCKEGFYGWLECKASKNAKHQQGQDEFIRKMDEWSYAKFVYPTNWPEIEKELAEMLK